MPDTQSLTPVPSDVHATSRWYDAFSHVYDLCLERLYAPSRREIGRRLGTEAGRTVVDLCCGTGSNFPHLSRAVANGGRLVAIDASAGMLRKAEARASRLELTNTALIHADVRRIDDADFRAEHRIDGVDAVVCALGLTVVPDWTRVLDAARALVRPGGRLIVMDGRTLVGPMRLLNPLLVLELRVTAHADVRRTVEERVGAVTHGDQVARFLFGHVFVAGGEVR